MNITDVNALQKYSYATHYRGNEINSKDPLLDNNTGHQNMAPPSATFADLPTELVDMILNTIPKLYSPKESAQQLSTLMLVNKEFYYKAIKIKRNIFGAEFKELLADGANIGLESPKSQMDWCQKKLIEATKRTEFSYIQIQAGIEFIISKVQHVHVEFAQSPLNGIQRDKVMDMIFQALLKKTNIKTLDLLFPSEINYDKYKFTSNFLWVLHKNPELSGIPRFSVDSDEFDIRYIPTLLQLLSGKNIDHFSLSTDRNKRPALNTFSKYLKNIHIEEFAADSSGITNEDISHLIGNFPAKLENIDLSFNHIDHDGAKLLFNGLQNTNVQCLNLEGNNLYGYKADDLRVISNFLALEEVLLSSCHLENERHKFSGIKNKHGVDIEFSWD